MEKVYQLLVHGRRFSLGTLASSTIKTGCHDIAEILLKVVLSTINQINRSNSVCSLKQQPMDSQTHYPDSEPISLCSYCLKLCVSEKQQIPIKWSLA
jgi:hypothetical protein